MGFVQCASSSIGALLGSWGHGICMGQLKCLDNLSIIHICDKCREKKINENQLLLPK